MSAQREHRVFARDSEVEVNIHFIAIDHHGACQERFELYSK